VGKRFGVLALAFALTAVFLLADPASAQYNPEGGFTVTPANIIQGQQAVVQGYCEIAEPVVIKLDNGTTVGSGVVPGVNDPQPRDTLATALVTITVTIPVATPAGNHTLYVYCHGVLIQILNIRVLAPACNTTGTQPPPLGGVYGIYGGDPQGAAPAQRLPDPNSSYQGTLTSLTTGLPIAGASVKLMRTADNTVVGPTINTDVNGFYAFAKTAVTVGKSYYVRFTEIGFTTTNSASATYANTPITLNKAMQVAPGGPGISGTITDSATGQLLVGVPVRLWLVESIGRYLATATDANGHYNFAGVPQGDYQLQVSAYGYASKWWVNASNRGAATVISINNSAVVASLAVTGVCKTNPTLIASIGDAGPLTLSTGAVILMMAGGWLVLTNSKRRHRRSHRRLA